jgi:hypothetical protein
MHHSETIKRERNPVPDFGEKYTVLFGQMGEVIK